MKLTNSETIKMYSAGGFRERYAMEHGNGAIYNTARGVWVA